MKTNKELRALARAQLKGGWGLAIGILLIYCLICSASNIVPGIGMLILSGPLTLGFMGFFIKKVRGEDVKVENLFDGFSNFGTSLLLYILQGIFIMLWSLLLVVPGIVKCFSYSMAFYILRDNPDIGAMEAITRSRIMMNGYKGKLFGLCFSFIGWCLLCVITFGIGYLWLAPYMCQAFANFYEDLKKNSKPAEAAAA